MMIITGMMKAQMKYVSYRNQQLREGGREGGGGGREEEGREGEREGGGRREGGREDDLFHTHVTLNESDESESIK